MNEKKLYSEHLYENFKDKCKQSIEFMNAIEDLEEALNRPATISDLITLLSPDDDDFRPTLSVSPINFNDIETCEIVYAIELLGDSYAIIHHMNLDAIFFVGE